MNDRDIRIAELKKAERLKTSDRDEKTFSIDDFDQSGDWFALASGFSRATIEPDN